MYRCSVVAYESSCWLRDKLGKVHLDVGVKGMYMQKACLVRNVNYGLSLPSCSQINKSSTGHHYAPNLTTAHLRLTSVFVLIYVKLAILSIHVGNRLFSEQIFHSSCDFRNMRIFLFFTSIIKKFNFICVPFIPFTLYSILPFLIFLRKR
jgi:hypothetical protein